MIPAPVPPDGYVAGQATHIQFVLVPDANPEVKGIGLERGEVLVVTMPAAFKRNPASPIREDSDVNVVLTKGWPQAPVQQAGQYRIFYDAANNAIGARAQGSVSPGGANGPGIKTIHLRGSTFINPGAGNYPVEVRHVRHDGGVRATWAGTISVLPAATAFRLAPTNVHLGPGVNCDFQRAGLRRDAPLPLGLYLWDGSGNLIDGVGIAPPDPTRFPRYRDGLLVQDLNGDKILDPAVDRVIGGVVIDAPPTAEGQAVRSPGAADGRLVLSGDALRSTKFPPATGAGKPEHGLLPIQFRTGNIPGTYRATIILLDGSNYGFTIVAQE
ncbi:MAG TPA: hypothetical protein VJX92_14275 [Methylomirabilota bacterium]|nr:hypothetical protein [Methylomirabilota bacterium]